MTKQLVAAGLALALAGATTPMAAWADPAMDQLVRSMVRVEGINSGRVGTGWVIEATNNEDRAGAAVIVTALNIIEKSKVIKVTEPASSERKDATVIGRDVDRNLAFLEVKDIAAPALTLARQSPKIGRTVFAAGFNRAADDTEQASAATATSKRGSLAREYRGLINTEARAQTNQLELDLTLLPGFEGGPALDDCGRVIGIDMKSGGEVGPREKMRIVAGADLNNALRADEVIASALPLRINVKAESGECGSSAAAPLATGGAVTNSEAAPVTPGAADQPGNEGGMTFIEWARENIVLVALLLLGLVAALFGIITLTRRRDDNVAGGTSTAAEPLARWEAPISRSEPAMTGTGTSTGATTGTPTGLADSNRSPTAKEAELRLTGRGPAGEAIDVRVPLSAVTGRTVTLGCGDNADYRITDNRENHKVSRLHALLGYESNQFYVEDNKSLNGTLLDGRKLAPHERKQLMTGDTVTLADVVLKVVVV